MAGLAVPLALATALSCGDDEMVPDPPEPTRVTVAPSSLEFAALGDTARLSAQVEDQYGEIMAGAAVNWASSDASVASVDSEGLVRSIGNGEAVVTAQAGAASDSASVTVAQVVSAVNVSPGALEFSALGDTLRLGAEPVDANGHAVVGAAVTWATGDAAVASVDSAGLVVSVGNGRAEVTATADSVSGTAEVTVAQVVSAVKVSPDTVAFSALGDTLRATAEALDANGHPVATDAFAWSVGDTTVAVVDALGLVRSIGNGEAVVTAQAGAASDSASVTVAQVVSAVNVSPGALEFSALGDTLRLGAEPVDANGHAVVGAAVTWATGDAAVASVDSAGLVVSVGNGRAEVTATADSVSGTAEVTVAQVVSAVKVSPDTVAFSALGDTLRATAEALDANGHPVATDAFAWSVGDTTVAVVDALGLVRSIGNGEAVATATAEAVSGTSHVTVRQKARAVTVTPAADTLRMDDTLRLAAHAFDANGHEIADDTRQFAWTSSHARIAEVNDSGLVAGIREGRATITAAMDGAGASAEVRVTNPDRAALRALYEATDGPNWGNSGNWMRGLDQ